MTTHIIIDGGADLPAGLSKHPSVRIVPLNLHFGDTPYKTGDLSLPTFYKKLKESNELPSSSSPSPNEFYESYKQVPDHEPILVLALSQGLSSTYESAVLGRDMLLEEQKDRSIAVLNTRTASCGVALLVHEAHRKMDEDIGFQDLVTHMEKRIEQTTTLFILKTLENVIKGGRLDKVKGAIAKTLNIKLLMKASEEGTIEVTEKVRGDKKAMRRFVDQIKEYTDRPEKSPIAISHCNDAARGEKVLASIHDSYPFQESLFMEMGPLISTYAGEGGLVISFFKE